MTTRVLRAACIAIAALLAAVPGAGSASSEYELAVSTSPDRSSAVSLQGETVSGNVFVFTRPVEGVSRVAFYLDDADRSSSPRQIEKNPPYDFAGGAVASANPFDTGGITDGAHTITAAITRSTGETEVVHGEFTVEGVNLSPGQIHLAWTADPSTTLTVVWHTWQSSTPSEVQYRQAGAVAWNTAVGGPRASGTTGQLHEATLASLSPQTEYEYRVRGEDGWGEIFSARTGPPADAASFDAIYVADTGLIGRSDGLTTGTEQVIEEIGALHPDVVLLGGDYAYYNTDKRFGTLEDTIDAWFDQMQPIGARVPMMPTYGNHEVLLGEGFDPWAARFPTPSGFDDRRYYSFDVGDAHFVSLLAVVEQEGLPQSAADWLAQDIAAANSAGARWVIPFFHSSPFADGSSHPSNLPLRAQLGPLFEGLGVKLAISSHDQSYERTYPLIDVPASNMPTSTALDCYTRQDGVTWLKTSPGGKLSNKNGDFSKFQTFPPPQWTAFRDDTMHHFTRLRFSDDGSLRVQTLSLSGEHSPAIVQDEFEYRDTCPGRLEFEPASISFGTVGEEDTPARTVHLRASDGEAEEFSVSDDAPWLSVSPASGSLPLDLSLSVDPSELDDPGTYEATVTANAPGRAPATLPVSLRVEPAEPAYGLVVSGSPQRANPTPLEGSILSGNDSYVFVEPSEGASRVRFWLDDPGMNGPPRQVEKNPPWDFAGGTASTANPFDTTAVSNGGHSITAAVEVTGGGTTIAEGTFLVAN